MIRHMRNMRSISVGFIRGRSIVSSLDCLLLVLEDVGFGKLDEFFAISDHS
jgi:hypothetical protein